jgi:dTDP-3-amino-3,4,6-trideoxy-alpha-D-glucopyranose N,N-dimethyltransferase/N-dimethyltransferase
VQVTADLYTTEADLYDIAFSWDTSAEIDWLLERLGGNCSPVLEPACGPGRMLEAFAERSVEIVGIDNSPAMVQLARQRLGSRRLPGTVVVADMVDFELDQRFGGAICPIDSLAHLVRPADVIAHLGCVASHLRPSSRYLVQLELRDPVDPWNGLHPSAWDAERGDIQLRSIWQVEEIDLDTGIEIQSSRFEIIGGPGAGRVFEQRHQMAAWTPDRWQAAIADTAFTYAAVYDGDLPDRPRRRLGQAGHLLWHELLAP